MSLAILMLSGLIAVIAIYFVMLYNGLVQSRHAIAKAWANIDVLLKQRHDELPNLVAVCKEYMRYEQETFTRVAEMRARVHAAREQQDITALGSAESRLRAGVDRIFAVAERYPELKANETFLQLQVRISQLEDAIADRRELYNESVMINNTRIEQFPDALIARAFDFLPKPPLRFATLEKAPPTLQVLTTT